MKLCRAQHLTGLLWRDITADDGLQNVKYLELNKCNEISFEDLEPFLEDQNVLEHCKFVRCEEITKRDFQNYQKKVKKWKWNVKVEWS